MLTYVSVFATFCGLWDLTSFRRSLNGYASTLVLVYR